MDDVIVKGTDLSCNEALMHNLQNEFKLKDLGCLSYFLDIHVLCDSYGLYLNQGKYIINLLDKVHMLGSKPYAGPCTSRKKLTKVDNDALSDPMIYRHIVGALQYCLHLHQT